VIQDRPMQAAEAALAGQAHRTQRAEAARLAPLVIPELARLALVVRAAQVALERAPAQARAPQALAEREPQAARAALAGARKLEQFLGSGFSEGSRSLAVPTARFTKVSWNDPDLCCHDPVEQSGGDP
jgi:hypothetical protein